MNMQPRIVRLEDARVTPPSPERFCALIPAAGRGTRLGADVPKALVELQGRPVLSWIWEALAPRCASAVVVAAPSSVGAFRAALQTLGIRGEVVAQDAPRGMADAVYAGLAAVRTEHAVVAWGDHASIRADTVAACTSLHLDRGASLTMPTAMRDEPYIELVRGQDDRLETVLERREGGACGERGESDCGVFVFETAALRAVLTEAREEGHGVGRSTGELNLLPLLPSFEGRREGVFSVRVEDLSQTVGLNTEADLRRLEALVGERAR